MKITILLSAAFQIAMEGESHEVKAEIDRFYVTVATILAAQQMHADRAREDKQHGGH